jgi:hypothetical protein
MKKEIREICTELKQVLKNACIGYNIRGKFYSLTKLRKHLVKPKQIDLPF